MIRILLFIFSYGGLAAASLGLHERISLAALIWPAAGVLLGTLMIAPYRRWPLWAGLAVVLHVAISATLGHRGLAGGLILGLVEPLVVAAVAWAWRHWSRGEDGLRRTRNLVVFIVALSLGATLGGLLVNLLFSLAGQAAAPRGWVTWTMSVGIGMLLGAPLVATWSQFRLRLSGGMKGRDFFLGLIGFVLMILSAEMVFDGPTALRLLGTTSYELTYLPLVFVVLIALTWEQRGMTLALIALALAAGINTTQGEGPFAGQQGFFGNTVLEVQAYIGAAALLGLLMDAVARGRDQALREAQTWKARYEAALANARQLVYEFNPGTSVWAWSGPTQELLGQDAAQLHSLDAFCSRVHPDDREQVRAVLIARADGTAVQLEQRFRYEQAPGQYRTLIETGAPVLDFDNSVFRVSGMLYAEHPAAQHA